MARTDVVTVARGLITGGGGNEVVSAFFSAVVLGDARRRSGRPRPRRQQPDRNFIDPEVPA